MSFVYTLNPDSCGFVAGGLADDIGDDSSLPLGDIRLSVHWTFVQPGQC